MKRNRNTKIIATLGPASSSYDIIERLFTQGVDIFRLNFSHGDYATHQQNYNFIREIEEKHNTSIAILMDLQGPKLRIGDFLDGSVKLETGQSFRLDLNKIIGNSKGVSLPHPEIFQALVPDTLILLDDGKIQLQVISCDQNHAETVVKVGGKLSNKKGVNLPGVHLPINAVTPKDKEDIQFGIELGIDFIGLSFVQSREDIEDAKSLIKGRAGIISKIEKPLALKNIESIIDASDGIMIARGDLGVEMFPEDVPAAQKRIVYLCREGGKPVVVATQMLESMIVSPTPTRAEVSDVANAVYDGADAVMLSGESAAGQYPLEAVAMMNRIIQSVEKDSHYQAKAHHKPLFTEATLSDAITSSAVQAAHTLGASVIVSFTSSGKTSLRLSRMRPFVPIIGVTPHKKVARRQVLSWGVYPYFNQEIKTYTEMVAYTPDIVQSLNAAKTGESVVITAGEPLGIAGGTNVLRIIEIS